MSIGVRKLGIGGVATVLWVVLLGALALPAFAAAPETPQASVEAITASSATFAGVLNPAAAEPVLASEAGTYQFFYREGKACEGGSKAPASPAVALGGPAEPVAEPVAGLKANTEYTVCLRAEKPVNLPATSAPVTFTTAPEAPKTEAATLVTASTATFHGVLNPKVEATAGFEFAYNANGPCNEGTTTELVAEAKVKGEHVEAKVTGLEPNKKYAVCLLATNAAGAQSTPGNSVPAETEAIKPTISSESSSGVKATEARLETVINPNNQATKCEVQYGTDATLATSTTVPCETETLENFGGQGDGVTVTGLAQTTTYYYRFLATNATGTEKDNTIDHFTTPLPPVAPEKATTTATAITASTATLHGVLNPKAAGEAGSYEFFYRPSSTECQGEGEAATPAGTMTGLQGQPVEATPTGLLPDRQYTFCLLARNTAGETILGPPVTFRTLAEAYTTEVTSDSAIFNAVIDPEGSSTTYHFEYGPSTEYGSETPVESAGSGPAALTFEAALQHLEPGTTYHYRVLVTHAGTTIPGEDHSFTTQPAGGELTLPDDRAWEMVSPPEKLGARIEPLGFDEEITQAATVGNALTYVTASPTEGEPPGNAGSAVQVLSTRGAAGWSTRDISVPHEAATGIPVDSGQEFQFFSSDLSLSAVEPFGDTLLSPEASEQTSYLRTDYLNGNVADPCLSSCFKPLVTAANVSPHTEFGECYQGGLRCGPALEGATPDLSHIFINSYTALVPGAPLRALYEWSAGQLQVVSVNNSGAISSGLLGGSSDYNASSGGARNAISDGGTRAVWDGGNLRINIGMPQSPIATPGEECTVLADACSISLAENQGGSGAHSSLEGANFWAASSDGSKIFFTDGQDLTPDANGRQGVSNAPGESAQVGDGSLYECEILEEVSRHRCRLSNLTPSPSEDNLPEVEGVLGASQDGAYVYFVANGVFAAGAVQGDCTNLTELGSFPTEFCNLYVSHDGATKFIARLTGADAEDWEQPAKSPTQVSPNGEWLTFSSLRDLTGYDNRDALTGQPVEELYLYNAVSGHLACVSCMPSGARPLGNVYEVNGNAPFKLAAGGFLLYPQGELVAATVPSSELLYNGRETSQYQPPFLDNNGRLFFNGFDALVPQDVNGTWDVYEYEPPGVGSCSASSVTFGAGSGGCVGLISSGTSAEESAFMGASEDGSDVFFLTAASLASRDLGNALDVYDAHECTATVPCTASSTTPPPCSTGDACKAAPTPQPAFYGAPASQTFSGAGNVTPSAAVPKKTTKKTVRCKKKFVKNKHGKCVKKPRKKAKRSTGNRRTHS